MNCPIRVAVLLIPGARGTPACTKGECAWWTKTLDDRGKTDLEGCAFKVAAEALDILKERV